MEKLEYFIYTPVSVSRNAPTNHYTNMYFSVFYTRSSISDVQHVPKVALRGKILFIFCCAHNGPLVIFGKSMENVESRNLETI